MRTYTFCARRLPCGDSDLGAYAALPIFTIWLLSHLIQVALVMRTMALWCNDRKVVYFLIAGFLEIVVSAREYLTVARCTLTLIMALLFSGMHNVYGA